MTRRALLFLSTFFLFVATSFGGPMTVDVLLKLHRISDPQVSPDGRTIIFSVVSPNVAENTRPSQIWAVSIDGGTPRQLTREGSQNTRPRWSPDGRRIAFTSNRGGGTQIWTMAADGSDARQVTRISTEAGGEMWSPDGKNLLFTSDVYPDCPDDPCNRARDEERSKSKVKARLITRLLYRHWNAWKDGKRSHLFVVSAEGGAPRDLTPGDYDVPPFSLGGPDDYAFSPDGREVVFTSNHDEVEAASTNNDLWIVPSAGGETKKITTNPASDSSPVYSPNGRWIAYRAQQRPGYESDRFRLMLYERSTGRHVNLTEKYDRGVLSTTWSPDSKQIYFVTEDQGTLPIMVIPATAESKARSALDGAGGQPKAVVKGGANDDVSVTPDGRTLVFTRMSIERPNEIYAVSAAGGEIRAVTRMNDELLAGIELPAPEAFWFTGAAGARVHGWVLKPPGFDPSKKYPAMFVLHGGPQTGFNNAWSFRWNAEVFAGAGYVVVMINRRGSTGFGQKFTDEINQDWGGKAYEDIMKGVDYVVANYPFVDPKRLGAAGGSYGGYLANWLAAKTDRFRCLVSHAGLYDLRSSQTATEELWFPIQDFGGMPWDNPEVYARFSPASYVKNFMTPTLVVHGALDFRVVETEAMQMFTALQLQKVPSQFLYFPDEGHWVLKPQNSMLWYKTVIGWWDRWLKK